MESADDYEKFCGNHRSPSLQSQSGCVRCWERLWGIAEFGEASAVSFSELTSIKPHEAQSSRKCPVDVVISRPLASPDPCSHFSQAGTGDGRCPPFDLRLGCRRHNGNVVSTQATKSLTDRAENADRPGAE